MALLRSRQARWAAANVAFVCWLAPACSSSGDDDGAPPSAGGESGSSGAPARGGSSGTSGGTAGSAAAQGGAGQAGSVDCNVVCAHVKTLCPERTDISDVWLDACASACDARVKLTPATADLERTCVEAALDCNAAVICVASPH